jgi:hypothetical protein
MSAIRRLQDIAVSTNPDETLWNDTAELVEGICARLEEKTAPAGVATGGRARDLP